MRKVSDIASFGESGHIVYVKFSLSEYPLAPSPPLSRKAPVQVLSVPLKIGNACAVTSDGTITKCSSMTPTKASNC